MGLGRASKVTIIGQGSSNGVIIPVDGVTRDARSDGGFVGRVCPDKGVPTPLAATELLTDQHIGASLLLVGPEEPSWTEGPAGYFAQALSGSLDPQFVRWTGPVKNPTTRYEQMDLLCLPTLRVGFFNVVLEAAVCRVLTVASRVTGCFDDVIDNETGLLFTSTDPVDLADKLSRLELDRIEFARVNRDAHSRAAKEFRRETVWERTRIAFLAEIARRSEKGKI